MTQGNDSNMNSVQGADRVILGDGTRCIFSTDSEKTGLNNNILVAAGSGSGKTMSIVEPAILNTFQRSLIIFMTKQKLQHKYVPFMKSRQYDTECLDFVHPEMSTVGYDPLDYISSYKDITALATSVVKANLQKGKSSDDEYWDNASIALLSAIIAYVLMTQKHPTFADVLEMLDNLQFDDGGGQIRTAYDEKFDALVRKDPSCFAVTNWRTFRMLPIRTAGCVFSTLNSTVSTVFTPELRQLFRMKRRVDFERIGSRKTALFVTTSPVNPAMNVVITMFYTNAFAQLYEFAEEQPDGKLPVPVHILADEFATSSCPVPQFDKYISVFREKEISVTLLIQSESQLTSLYGEAAATTIINNCDTYVFMGANDLETARSISLRCNKPLHKILQLPVGQQILLRRGSEPVIGKRYNILEDEAYQEVTRAYVERISRQMKRGRIA